MAKPTLLVLAAGMGSRYGGVKQIDAFGPTGETIMDYSLFDAIRAGFGKIVVVIRREIEAEVKALLMPKLADKIPLFFAFQEGNMEGRSKPWGTAHAILSAQSFLNEPFAVINADDFYGFSAYQKMANFLANAAGGEYAMMGYQLQNTLSDFGSVARGVCETDQNGYLKSIVERTKIFREGAKTVYQEEGKNTELSENVSVSMNFWGFMPDFLELSLPIFEEFRAKNRDNAKAEFFIPLVVDILMKEKHKKVKVLESDANWFGVTYKEDKAWVQVKMRELIENEEYPYYLWK